MGAEYFGVLVWDSAGLAGEKRCEREGGSMILSFVVFAFGLVICGIVALGILNAKEVADQMEARQLAMARQQSEWEIVSEKAARRHLRSKKRAA